MKPGATIISAASKISASLSPAYFPGAATSFTTSPSSKTSIAASVFDAGSITRPFLISNILGVLRPGNRVGGNRIAIGGAAIVCYRCLGLRGRMSAVAGIAGDQEIENRHAHGDAIGDLLENAGLRAVSDFGRDFDAAIHWARMEDECIGLGALEAFGVELVAVNVVVGADGWLMLSLGLHAQHDDDVGVLQRFFDFVDAADGSARSDFFQFAGNPHGRAAKREAAAKFSEKMNIGASDS